MRIDELMIGQTATVSRIDDTGSAARDALRLRELGFDEGVEIELQHRGIVGGDPVSIRVGSNVIAMRRNFARLVRCRPIAEAAE